MTENNNIVKDWSKLVSLSISFLICLAVLSQSIYYFFFNIRITEFLDFSEILLLFAQDIIRYLIVIIIISILTIIFTSTNSRINKKKRSFIEYCNTSNGLARLGKYLFWNGQSMVFFILALAIFLTMITENSKEIYLFSLYLLIIILNRLFMYLIQEIRRDLRLKNKLLKKDYKSYIATILAANFSFFIITWTIIDVSDTKYKHKNSEVSFRVDGELIESDTINYYIGQTKNYVFHYNSSEKITTVYNRKDVSAMCFGKVNYFGKIKIKNSNK